MPLWENGVDADFTYKLGDDLTYSDDNKDYSIIRRIKLINNQKFYFLRACDEKNSLQLLKLNADDESKLTLTTCKAVLTKLWPTNVTYDGDYNKTKNYIMNSILGRVCDYHAGEKNKVKIYIDGNTVKLDFEGETFSVEKS
tara:strand:+ start:614 stop:1036 length:423 start_codon:yes stop_codon:yes gene_type:complete